MRQRPDWADDVDWSEYHPTARKLLADEFFWDPADEAGPHGHDAGADLLVEYLEERPENPREFLNAHLLEAGLGDASTSSAAIADDETLDEAFGAGSLVLAVAFAQLKIEGHLDDDLRRQALAVANARRRLFPSEQLDMVRAVLRARTEVSEVELVGGVEQRELVLAEYDPAWTARFAAHRERLAAAVGEVALSIDHIGSTSVPELAAKPIIDVLLVVPDLTEEEAYLPALEAAGYELRVREPEHRMVRTPERDVHVHVLEADDPGIDEYLALRDRLRSVVSDRKLYEATKRELVARGFTDMNAYAEAKGEVIAAIKARARQG